MKNPILIVLLFLGSLVFMSSCVEEDLDMCAEIADEYWELRDAYDAYVSLWEEFTPEQKGNTPLVQWLLQDPEQRAARLADFNAENASICPRLDRPESMEVYR